MGHRPGFCSFFRDALGAYLLFLIPGHLFFHRKGHQRAGHQPLHSKQQHGKNHDLVMAQRPGPLLNDQGHRRAAGKGAKGGVRVKNGGNHQHKNGRLPQIAEGRQGHHPPVVQQLPDVDGNAHAQDHKHHGNAGQVHQPGVLDHRRRQDAAPHQNQK